MPKLDRVTVNPDVMGGRPCIRGLRMPVSRILGMLAAGEAEILARHPNLELEEIRQSLAYAVLATDGQVMALAG